ncbi:MAG TPA: DUF3108 domain-containing protein [Alphaproteobacteria bacterium]|nr:DUF3108 domain-containing protein [Alphaproteobacteria bacterium]
MGGCIRTAFALPQSETIFAGAMVGVACSTPARSGFWRLSAGALALCAAFLVSGGQAATSSHALALAYQVLLGPLPVMTVTADLALPAAASPEGSYRADIVGRAGGYAGQVYDWSFTARSEGLAQGRALSPRRFSGENLSALDRRPVQIAYAADGTPAPRFDPPRAEDADLRPRPTQAKGTLDPASAIVALVRTIATTGSCAAALPVYDGRRRFDLISRAGGEELVEPLPRSLYGGPAQRCELQLNQLDAGRERLPSQGTAWIAEIAGARVPVRLELTTALGIITVDLVQATTGPSPL